MTPTKSHHTPICLMLASGECGDNFARDQLQEYLGYVYVCMYRNKSNHGRYLLGEEMQWKEVCEWRRTGVA